MSFVVTVSFAVKSEAKPEFLALVLQNARTSLAEEPGCHQFDVCTDGDDIFLYEVYQSSDAFALHLATSHFLAFDAAVSGMVISKDVRTYERAGP